MATSTESNDGVPLSWIAIFLLLALGLGASAVLYVGGSVLPAIAPLL